MTFTEVHDGLAYFRGGDLVFTIDAKDGCVNEGDSFFEN